MTTEKTSAIIREKGILAVIRELPDLPAHILDGRSCCSCGTVFNFPRGIPCECSQCGSPVSTAEEAATIHVVVCPFCHLNVELLKIYRHIRRRH